MPLPHIDAFNTFANRADPDQTALAAISGSTPIEYGNMIRYDPTLLDMTNTVLPAKSDSEVVFCLQY